MDASDIYAVDAAMLKADGTRDKSGLGANAIPVSYTHLDVYKRQIFCRRIGSW